MYRYHIRIWSAMTEVPGEGIVLESGPKIEVRYKKGGGCAYLDTRLEGASQILKIIEFHES